MSRKLAFLERVFRNNHNQEKIKQPGVLKRFPSTSTKMALEQLEPRVLLSGDTMAFLADAAHANLTIRVDNSLAEIVDSNTGNVLLSRALEDTTGIAITGSDGDDSLRIDSTAASVVPISFDGGAGRDSLLGFSDTSTWNITGDGSGSVGSLTFTSLENLVVDASPLPADASARERAASDFSGQVVFLSLNGADDVDYNGPVSIHDIDVTPFQLPFVVGGDVSEFTASLVTSLEGIFAGSGITFTTDQPVGGDYSTIFIGGNGEEFSDYGRFQGLSEKIDVGNLDHKDNAFVFSDNIFSWTYDAAQYGAVLATYAAHELGHLLGFEHAHEENPGNPLAPLAWDPRVHVEIGNDVRADLADDGKLTIDGNTYDVHPAIKQALNDWPAFFNAGIVGPDGFPDVLMGQFAIHPIDNGTWMTRILDMAWAAQTDPSYTAAERSQILAWSFGMLVHSAGDHFAHTLVNEFAEGVAPGFVAAAKDERDLGNMLRHFLTEAYIADALPGFDANLTDREVVPGDPNGDISNISSPGIPYDAPIRFIYETLIRAYPDDPTPIVEMKWDKGTLVADAATDSFTRDDLGPLGLLNQAGFESDGFKVGQKITVAGFTNPANNGTFLLTAVTPTKLTVSGALANETASGDETIVVHVPKTAVTTIGVDTVNSKFTRSSGSFLADGFVEGQRFTTFGFSDEHTGDFIVKSVTAGALEVYGKFAGGNEAGSGDEQLVVYGARGPILDGLFKLRDKLFKKAVEQGDRPASDFGTLVGTLLDDIVKGIDIPDSLKSDLFLAYLYNWVDELDAGIRHWGEVGLAFTKAMFDAQSKRDLQNKVGAAFGPDTLANTARANAENGVGVLSVLIAELDDPNGDGLTDDSFINNHLLPMIGLPSQLGVLRMAVQTFFSVVHDFFDDGDIDPPFDPQQPNASSVETEKAGFLKKLFEKRYGIPYDVFDFLTDRASKMDLKTIDLPLFDPVSVFAPGDHEKLDAYMGITAPNHHVAPPAGYNDNSGFEFYADAEGPLQATAEFSKTNFIAYADSVVLSKMLLLMESPVGDAVAGAGAAAGQLSKLYSDVLQSLGAPPNSYDFSLLNLNGAHGGNILTATLPGAPGSDTLRPWLPTIDSDNVWRADSATTTTALYRISYNDDALSPAVFVETGLAAGTYKVYASWLANVTQKLDNESDSNFPDQRITLDEHAQYTVLDDATVVGTVQKNQKLFSADIDHDGLGYALLGEYTIASGTLKVQISNLTGSGNNVIAGPILLVPTAGGSSIVIQNDRSPDDLTQNPGSPYSDNSTYWTDLVYPTGTGNNPLWESATLRPVFRELFTDWRNGSEQFPDLNDTTSPDPNSVPIAKVELPSTATPTGPVIPDHVIDIPITAAVKNFILDGLNDVVDFAKTIEATPPFNIELPGIDKSVADLLDISGNLQTNVQQPIVDYFAADLTPTVGELFDVIKAKMGGILDTIDPVMEFNVDLRKSFTVDDLKLSLGKQAAVAGLELNATVDLDAAVKFVDSVLDDMPVLTFGINLTPDGSIDAGDRVYLKVERAILSADIHASNLDFGARLGFLSIGVDDASIDLTANIEILFNDPNLDGKITLGEIADTPLADLIDVIATGTLDGTLPITATLAGLTLPATPKITFSATNIFDLGTYSLDFSGIGLEAPNFSNMTAAGFVSLLGVMSNQLQDLRDSKFFTDLKIPFVKGAVTDVLDFAESFSDKLLFNDGANNKVDGADFLSTDLNAAIVAAELGSQIIVQGTGTGLKFVAIDPTITGFKVEVGVGDPGGFSDLGVTGGGSFALTHNATPSTAVLSANAVLKITIQRGAAVESHDVTLKSADTSDNTTGGIGDDTIQLLRGDNSATFDTAQGLAFRLTQVLGLSDIVTYNPADDSLTVNVGALLPRKSFSNDYPVDFNLDLGSLAGIESNSIIRVSGSAGLDPNFIFGVYLGSTVPGAVADLTTSTSLGLLNEGDGVDIKKTPAITAPDPVSQIHGRLQSDATFKLEVTSGTTTTSSFTVRSADTSTNQTTADLAADINASLATAAVRSGPVSTFVLPSDAAFTVTIGVTTYNVSVTASNTTANTSLADLVADVVTALKNANSGAVDLTAGATQLTAVQDGSQIVFKTAAGGAAQFTLNVTAATPAETILKLTAGSTTGARLNSLVTAIVDGNRLGLIAKPTVTAMNLTADKNDSAVKEMGFQEHQTATGPVTGSNLDNFVLETGDALFKLKIGATSYDVTVTKASTVGNTTIGNLVTDVNAALAVAKISGTGTTVNLSGKITAEASGSALRLRIIDAAISSAGLSAAIDNPAVFDLGLSDEATITLPLISAVKDVPLLVGRVASDTTLNFAINGGAPIPVTLYSDDTATNTTIISLVSDLNQALHSAAVKGGTISNFAPGAVTFSVGINGGSLTPVNVLAADTAGNTSLSDLILDINKALNTAGFGGLVTAKPSGVSSASGQARILLEGNSDAVSRLEVTATGGNALALPTSVISTSLLGKMDADSAGNKLILSGVDSYVVDGSAPGSFVLGSDATLGIQLLGAAASTTVTLKKSDTTDNTRLEHLVKDLNIALADALSGKIHAEVSGNAIVLRSVDPSVKGFTVTSGSAALGLNAGTATLAAITGFQLSAAAGLPDLGLGALSGGPMTADSNDLVIYVSNPGLAVQPYKVNLDTATDILSVKTLIENATDHKVTVSLNDGNTGLTLTDTTFIPVTVDSTGKLISNTNSKTFAVAGVNGSAAGIGLGIIGVDSLDAANLDGKIDGKQISGIKLTDRFFVANASVSADLAISTPQLNGAGVITDTDSDGSTNDGIDAKAHFGFVGVSLTGGGSLNAKIEAGLVDPTTSGAAHDGRISLTEFIDGLKNIPLANDELPPNTQKMLQLPSLTGDGSINLGVKVTGVPFTISNTASISIDVLNLGDVFDHYADEIVFDSGVSRTGNTTFTLAGDHTSEFGKGARVTIDSFKTFATAVAFASGVTTVTVSADDTLPASFTTVKIGTPLAPAIDFHFSGLDDLLSFQNVDFNFSSIIHALVMLSDFLGQFDSIGGVLNAPIPLANVSVNDLLSFAEKLSDAIDNAQSNPAGTLQFLDQKISEAFGVDPASNLLVFAIDDFGTPGDRSDDVLKIELNLSEGISKSLSVEIPNVDLGPVAGVVDFGGAATLSASGSADLKLHVGIGFSDPTKIYFYDSSDLSANLNLSGTDMAFHAALGPFSLSIIDGQASIAGSLDTAFDAGLFTDHRMRLDTDGAIGDLLDGLTASLTAPVNVTLPIYFPTDSHGIGDITLTGDLTNITNGLYVKTDSDPAPSDKIVLDVSDVLDEILSGFSNMSLLDQILFVVDGVDLVLGGVQDALDGDIMGFKLPLVGDSLADGAHFIQDFRSDFIANFRDGVEHLGDPNDDAIKGVLFNLLGPTGLNLLLKANGAAGGTLADIQNFSNLDSVSDVKNAELWWKFKIGESKPIPNDISLDLGIPGLGLKTEGDIVLTLGWQLDFGFGLSGKDGFFFFIDDPDELTVTADVTLPGASLTGTLGFLQFTAVNKDVDGDGDQTHLHASFGINIKNSSDPLDTRLGLSELGKMGFDVLVGADASAELGMTLGIAGDNGGFPQIKADFILDWAIDGNPGVDGIQPISLFSPPPSFNFGKSIQSGLKLVEFRHVSLDVGSYITRVVGPIVRKIKEVTEPVQPIIDIVTTPLPVLSDLGLDITLLDIAKQTGAVDAGFIDALEKILQVVSTLNSIQMPADGSLLVPFGDFTVYSRSNSLFDGLGDFDLGSAKFDLGGFADKILKPGGPLASLISGLPSGLQGVIGEVAGVAGDVLKGLADKSGASNKKPFSFPIIEDPSQVFGMLMGTPAVLVAYDMAPLNFDAEFTAFFSIFGPLGVSINLEAKLTIDFAFGYDTKGFSDFADSGFKNPLLLANGLFVSDDPTNPTYDGTGDDPPELTFTGGLWAAAELNLGIARGGVGGGIFIGVNFNLFDPDHDGRIRLDELLANFLNQLKAPNVAERFLAPLAVFDVHGKVTAELFAFLKIDFGFFELNKRFNITPPQTLTEFDVNFFRPPVLATEMGNGDLLINIGDFAKQRVLGDTTDFGEHIFVEDAGAGKVAVWSDNMEDAGADAKQIYNVTGKIIAVGGEGDDIIDLSGVHAAIRYDLDGGVGRDTLKGSDGGGIMKGGAGDDILLQGGAGADLIFGNEGKDIIHGGGSGDIAFGDGGDVPPTFDLANRHGFVRALFALTDGDDEMYGDGGDDILIGSGGIDTITGGTGNDLIIGDSALLSFNSPPVVTETDNDPQGFNDILKGGDDDDILWGGKGIDDIQGEGGNDIIYGGAGSDVLKGGTGNDIIFGDNGKFINGNLNMPAVIDGGDGDTIEGGAGNDRLLGGGGSDVIHGDAGDDTIEGGTGTDTLYGDADNDTILGGSDPDKLYGGAGSDVLEGGQGNDILEGGDGIDTLIAGYGSDTLDGQEGSDFYLISSRGGISTELTTAYDTGTGLSDTDIMTVTGTGSADVFLLRAMADYYFPKADKKLEPAVEKAFIKSQLLSTDEEKHELIRDYIIAAYGPHEAPAAMLTALDAVNLNNGAALTNLKKAINDNYEDEQSVLGSDNDTAFVALLNNGGANVERFNYRNMEGLVLNTVGGNDLVVSDDVTAATTINLGTGDDRVQVGQVFRSERTVDDPPLITHIAADDVFTTIEITRGWLSNGVTVATTVNGGDGNDEFTVFHNIAALNLNGGDGDDLFTVRAFALAGSTDSERGRTDMKGDAGADTILYAVNAPVGIDGGDGFDTVRIIGTEFSDDFVVTDSGVFGAGLNVSYVNIEKLVADGAEGDDRFFVLSTGIEVVTELDGGLGSDSFFMGGSPSDAPIPVISNDFKGHSGIILHNVESGDLTYQGVTVDGVSANVADNEESFIIVTPSGGVSRVTEGATSGGEGWEFDTYTIRLSRAPEPGKLAIINIVPAALPPEDEAKGYKDLEFYDPANLSNLLPYDVVTGKQALPVLTFTSGTWNTPQTVKFRAAQDTGSEGTRFVFINHTTSNSTDALYSDAKLLSVKVQVNDDDRAGVLVTPSGTDNTVLEGGFTDSYQVVLTRQPSANVTVTLTSLNNQVSLSSSVLNFSANALDANAWNKPQTVTLTAIDDAVVEGFHTDFITYSVSSSDADQPLVQATYKVDGDPDKDALSDGLPDDIPPEKPVSFMFLSARPLLDQPISILYDADGVPGPLGEVALAKYNFETDSVLRYSITGNTLEFFRNGNSASISGSIRASFSYTKPGYNGTLVKDTSIDIYDNDAPAVIVTQSDGSTDTLEGGFGDSYSVMLSRTPSAPVTVVVDAVNTRTTLDGFARFQEQVEVSTDNINFASKVELTFSAANAPQTVYVRAINDLVLDGSDTQVFAPEAHTVNKIRGPLLIEGAAGAGSLSLPAPLMLPGELNIRPSDGTVAGFTTGSGEGAIEFMTVDHGVIQDLLDDATQDFDTLGDFIDKTVELTEGPGTGVVLDATRPRDLFDRFWLIKEVQTIAGDPSHYRLKLQNPSMVNPSLANVTAPVAGVTRFAITNLSVNFFVDEKQSVDFATVFDEDSVANKTGRLTSSDGNVLSFSGNTMVVETSDLQALAKILGIVDLDTGFLNKTLDITVGPGLDRSFMITGVVNGVDPGTKQLTLSSISGSGDPTNRSEYRIQGGDRKGRITGFGMGPNVVIGNGVQPGGITYGDMEVLLMNMGSGNDTVTVNYTTNSEDHTTKRDGDYYTLTMLNTGPGNDNVTVKLQNGDDGAFALNTEAGNDTVVETGDLGIVMFGGEGNDNLTGGDGDDIVFGDIGRVDYLSNTGEIVTRLGHTVPQSPVNPPTAYRVTSGAASTLTDSSATFTSNSLVGFNVQVVATNGDAQVREITANTATQITVDTPWTTTPNSTFFYRILFKAENTTIGGVQRATLTDALGNFETAYGGLVGLGLQVISPDGHVQFRQIISNTATQLVLDKPWDTVPVVTNPATPQLNFFYRVASYPEDQTDGVIRGPRVVWSINNGTGGNDTLNGGAGKDIVIGGAGGDTIHGNAGVDWLAGDNARFDYVPVTGNDGPTMLSLVQTTGDTIGSGDTISGDADSDYIFGGAGGDTIYGDAASPGANDVEDFVIGDNGVINFNGGYAGADSNPATIDLIQSSDPVGLSGDDTIFGNAGRDVLIGGSGGDNISGDADVDTILGDQGTVRLFNGVITYVQDPGTPGDDFLTGGAGVDLIIGGLGNDAISGLGGNDILIGDEAEVFFSGTTITKIDTNTLNPGAGGADTIFGGDDDDIIIGGANGDRLDGGNSRDLIFGDNVTLNRSAGSGDAIDPRFRTLTGATIYGADGSALVSATDTVVPGGRPGWGADWTITQDQTLTASHFGDDYIAGGAGDDEIFGQLGNDTIQGDGTIGPIAGAPASFIMPSMVFALASGGNTTIAAPTAYGATRSGTLTVVNSFEGANDGDDYIEGNGGSDVVFGNLGQDDIVGGSSSLFSLGSSALRPDDADILFGGAGTDLTRNNLGDATINAAGDIITTSPNGHSRDADMILGDNGNIFRLVSGGAYLTFSYDNYTGSLKIIPRAAQLLDYTPGGQDFSALALSDLGAADEIHGESGDDFIYGMKGTDVLFGEGQDDDIIGGYGNDWISGGTGDDGVLGDDGRIYTSRNGTAESLYDIPATTQTDISTPGKLQTATINVTGQLKKTVNLTPFSVDPTWPLTNTIDEFGGADTAATHPHRSDDIIYGGWGNDALHGGSGDDAMSGAEALPAFYSAPTNPGNVLGYAANRVGEFALYDEFNPLTKIAGFLLNFDANEGVKVGTVNGTTFYSDGNDVMFGDLSNDWMVGGTGKDNLYGGWGDDLLNVDDNLETAGGLNNAPDTNPTYEDRAYGGAGRDVLIGNTGGDRLIDWVGEFNTFLVPFAPFGAAAISRNLQPQLQEFLYALSASDGADPTRDVDNSLPSTDPRNGEPLGELGVVIQKDFSWKAQTGAPDDPQAGNIPGGPRDVLRSANFNDGQAQGFVPDNGNWTVTGGRYQVSPATTNGDAVSVFYVDGFIPSYFEILATINAQKPTGGSEANSYVIFDYQGPNNFKFAGVNASTNKLEIGHRNASGWIVDVQGFVPGSVKSDTDYNVFLAVNGLAVTLTLNNQTTLSYVYSARVDAYGISHGLNDGMVGLGARNATAQIDNVAVQRVPPATTLNKTVDFSAGTTSLFMAPLSGTWNLVSGRYEGAAGSAPAIDLTAVKVLSYSMIDLSAKLKFSGEGGFIYDQYGPQDFKFVTISAGKITFGHRTSSGFFTDSVVNNTSLVAGTDFTLGLTLKGTTVNVTLGGQTVASYVYNALVTDGRFGLFSRAGTTSFDTVTVKSDDPSLAGQSFALTAAAGPATASMPGSLTEAELSGVANEAIQEWLAAAGSNSASALNQVQFAVVNDLPGDAIAWNAEDGTILIDQDAAGYGWFVDDTPGESSEFQNVDGVLTAPEASAAYGKMDLLTAVLHEIGHLLGYGHSDTGLMEATVAAGQRKLQETASSPVIDWTAEFAGIDLGNRQSGAGFPEFAVQGTESTKKTEGDLEFAEVEWHVEI